MASRNMSDSNPAPESQVDFGHRRVDAREKPALVDEVFHRVARRYDVMNDLMSLGTHRLFKRMLLQMLALRPGQRVLDLAGGTGDLSILFSEAVGDAGEVILTDPNGEMLKVAQDRLWDAGCANVTLCQAPGESLPFPDESFDRACISFGLRNFTDKDQGLKEILRCLKPGGILGVLEFSTPEAQPLRQAYGAFQRLWPIAGRQIVGDAKPYEYLVESIQVHPDQRALKQMFDDAGFVNCSYHNLLGGIAAIHRGERP